MTDKDQSPSTVAEEFERRAPIFSRLLPIQTTSRDSAEALNWLIAEVPAILSALRSPTREAARSDALREAAEVVDDVKWLDPFYEDLSDEETRAVREAISIAKDSILALPQATAPSPGRTEYARGLRDAAEAAKRVSEAYHFSPGRRCRDKYNAARDVYDAILALQDRATGEAATCRQHKPKEDSRAPKGGWAAGGYLNDCQKCGERFIGDKRATSCADCAYAPSAIAEAVRAEQMRDEQFHNCLHGENALAAAFDLPDDVTNLHRWIIETFAPAGWEKRLGPFFTQWLLRTRAPAGEKESGT